MKKSYISVVLFFFTTIMHSQTLPKMVLISGGEYVMGSNTMEEPSVIDDDGIPAVTYTEHRLKVDSFKISEHEVTFAEYFDFLNETGYKTYAELEWLSRNEKKLGKDGFRKLLFNVNLYSNYPVTRIAYDDALMYCSWLGKKTGKVYRLPTEAEWEYVATAGKMILYPWGNEYNQMDKSHNNEYTFDASFQNDIFPITEFSQDKSAFGVYGMYGNATEWCFDAYDPLYYYHSSTVNPLQLIRKYKNDMSFRGSVGYSMETGFNTVKTRFFASPFYYVDFMGFRVVEEIQVTRFNKGTEEECIYLYQRGFSNDSNVNVREKPLLSGSKLFQLQKGEEVQIYARTTNKMIVDGFTEYWYCVRKQNTVSESDMLTGWVFGAYLTTNEE